MLRRARRAIDVYGIVQGVGFRPALFRLARELRLTGTVANTAAGVAIEVQGAPDAVDAFVARLPREAPALARILDLSVRDAEPRDEEGFRIVASREDAPREALVLPDAALCADCRRELFDPSDRRYRYPFINCTHCGPRFTLLRDIPYDRPRTAMARFEMCADCRREYEDPSDRRFHAQATCCPACGPRVSLLDDAGRALAAPDPVAAAAERLTRGEVVAIKGIGGFQLAVDATDARAVARLRERKRRVEKPFAVMVSDLAAAAALCELTDEAARLLESPEAPIVLLRRRSPSPVADEVAPFNRDLGLFLPYTPLHRLLFDAGAFRALVMTSGNLSEEPIACRNEEAVERLRGMADAFLVHDRAILHRCDDSVVRLAAGDVRPLRLARGHVPAPVLLDEKTAPVLAVGGELKNTVCFTRGRYAFLSQHVGDLENAESYAFFQEAVEHLRHLLGARPEVIAHDLHPDYFSTRWAREQRGVRLEGVQHHHAHIAACMAEHRLRERVIGVALDGTGLGTDGRIWGGEVLLADYAGFERVAHLEYVSMPGGEAAIREPWRMAVSYLHRLLGDGFLDLDVELVRRLDRGATTTLLHAAARGVNAPLTSSCGRLFDAVAALAGVRSKVNYEAQAAIELEMAMTGEPEGEPYPFALEAAPAGWVIGTRPLFEAILDDLRGGAGAARVSRRFHDGLVEVLVETARRVRDRSGLERVCLSGGSFQNTYLLEQLVRRLEAVGFGVFAHRTVPAGDGGLSLGQARVAAWRVRGA